MRAVAPSSETAPFATGRSSRAHFEFERTPKRTFIARQHVGYPFHVTRPFYFDSEPAHLATLYLQSASGGIYSGDDLSIGIEAAPDTAVHVTSQASTIVHDTRGIPARQTIDIDVGAGAFVAFATDPLILFPSAEIEQALTLRLAPGAAAMVTDAFLSHDPAGEARLFGLYRSVVEVEDHEGSRLLVDRTRIQGSDLHGPSAPQGGYSASASIFAIGIDDADLPLEAFEAAVSGPGLLSGASRLPNDIGIGMRVLADGGVPLSRALEQAFEVVFAARFGARPSRRRK